MAALSLDPVSAAVYGLLNVSALTGLLATNGLGDDIAQATAFPYVWYEVREVRDLRGFGTGGLPEVEILVHTFSAYEGLKEAHAINQQAIALLKDQALTVAGYRMCGHVFYAETVPLPEQTVNDRKVYELVSRFYLFVEEA